MKLFLLCLMAAYCTAEPNLQDIPDYYWREWNGNVPDDAVEGGYTRSGEKVYIGRGLAFKTDCYADVPAALIPSHEKLSTIINGIVDVDDHIMILCSRNKNSLKWVKITSESFYEKIQKYRAVEGGLQRCGLRKKINKPLFIGRTIHAGELLPGRILRRNETHVNFQYVQDKDLKFAQHFEVLVYNI